MNKKILVLTVVVSLVILAAAGFLFFQPKSAKKYSVADSKNNSYLIDGQKIVLLNGISQVAAAPDSASKLTTQYFGNEVKADFNGDRKTDVAFLLTQDAGGTGIFYYVAAVVSSAGGYKGTNAILLGDRIAPQTTEFSNGKIIVNYADRKPNEPMSADPTVGVSRYFTISGENLAEVQK